VAPAKVITLQTSDMVTPNNADRHDIDATDASVSSPTTNAPGWCLSVIQR
jgi:hypothetical protein